MFSKIKSIFPVGFLNNPPIFGVKFNLALDKPGVKYSNKEFETIVSTNIYGNKVAIIIWLEHDPVAIVIQQPDVVKTYKNYFNLLWKIAKK